MTRTYPRTNEIADPEGSTAALWAARWFGGPTTLRQSTVSVGVTITRLLPNNPRRVFWQVINRSINNISIGFDNNITVSSGIPLAPTAGFATMAVQEDGESVSYEVTAIADVIGSTANIIEIIRV